MAIFQKWTCLDDNDDIDDFNAANDTVNLFNVKAKITGQTGKNGTKNVEIMVPFKCLSNFWRTSEMSLINCEINLDLNWSKKWVIVAANTVDQAATFLIPDTKLYVPVVTLSTQDNAKLLQQLKYGSKITMNWKNINQKYQQKDQINI